MMEQKNTKKQTHRLRTVILVVFAIMIVLTIAMMVFLKNTVLLSYPKLEGYPEAGKWYSIAPEGTKSSDGSEWHGLLRLGTENKVVVYYFGGGVSITGETSEQGTKFFATTAQAQDFVASGGIGSNYEENPFKNWTFLVVPYASGDFHSGTGEYHYNDENGTEQIVYHNGYNNCSSFVEAAKPYIGEPDTLLVTGFSAGGFAAALLADDVIDRFPSAQDITVCVDSSLLLYDGWHKTAVELWHSPSVISERLKTDNLVLDCLTALYEKRGSDVKILFDCSIRDDTLQQYQAYIRTGTMSKSKENGDLFQLDLARMVDGLQKQVPGVGIFIWEYGMDESTHNTQHTIISSNVFDQLDGGKSVADWINEAVMGDVKSYGLNLLTKQYD